MITYVKVPGIYIGGPSINFHCTICCPRQPQPFEDSIIIYPLFFFSLPSFMTYIWTSLHEICFCDCLKLIYPLEKHQS